MTYTAIAALLNILPIIRHQEQLLISRINNFYNFDHNVFLLDSSVDFNCFFNTRTDAPKSLYVFNNVEGNLTGLENLKEILSKNTFLIVFSTNVNFESYLNLLTQIKRIQRLEKNLKIGLFFTEFSSTQNLQNLFEWCWNHKIVNIFAVSCLHSGVLQRSVSEHSINIFTFNPFGKFDVVNVTETESFNNFFLSQNSNFHKHSLRLGQVNNYTYLPDEKLWHSVFSVLNATFTEVEVYLNSINDITLMELDTIDVMGTSYSVNPGDVVNVYPIIMEAFVIVVPEAMPYSEISTYLLAVTSGNIFSYSLISIIAVMLLLTFFRYMQQKKILFFRSAADVLNLLINDNLAIKYQELSRVEMFLIVPLTFAGFVITNGILSTLKSYLTRPVLQPQIKTVDDIYRSPFPIFSHYDMYLQSAIDVLGNLSKHEDWTSKFYLAKFELVDKEMRMFNTSISFLERLSYANFVLDVQKRLNIRGYYVPELYIHKCIVSYPVNDDFPFIERLNEIIHWIRNAGLYEKWRKENFNEFVKYISQNREFIKTTREQSEVEQFEMPIFIVYGWIVGLIVFVIEIIWKKLKLSWIVSQIKSKK